MAKKSKARTIAGKTPVTKKNVAHLEDRISTVSLLDRFSTYPSKGLTPERLASLLRDADAGDVYRQMELFEEMLEKDGKLFSLFQSRRLRVSKLNYEVMAASDDLKDVEIADAAAEMINRIEDWDGVLNDILDAVPKGYSVMNLDWRNDGSQWDIVGARQIHSKKFRFGKVTDQTSDPDEIRMIVDPLQTESYRGLIPDSEFSHASTDGIALDCDPVFRKRFAVTFCKARSGSPARASLLRTCTYLFLFKNYDIKWWVGFAEILLGYRIGKYDPSQDGMKELLEDAVRGLGTDAAAVITNDSSIEFVEMAQKATSNSTFKDLKDWVNEEYSLVVDGHTGSSTSTPGKLGGEDAAIIITQALNESDAKKLDATVSGQILRPWVELNHGPQKAYPYYKTHAEVPKDVSVLMAVAKQAQDIGYPVPKSYIKELTGIPAIDPSNKDDEILTPRQVTQPNPFGSAPSVAGKDLREKLLMGR